MAEIFGSNKLNFSDTIKISKRTQSIRPFKGGNFETNSQPTTSGPTDI